MSATEQDIARDVLFGSGGMRIHRVSRLGYADPRVFLGRGSMAGRRGCTFRGASETTFLAPDWHPNRAA
jgi:hypothetical protein